MLKNIGRLLFGGAFFSISICFPQPSSCIASLRNHLQPLFWKHLYDEPTILDRTSRWSRSHKYGDRDSPLRPPVVGRHFWWKLPYRKQTFMSRKWRIGPRRPCQKLQFDARKLLKRYQPTRFSRSRDLRTVQHATRYWRSSQATTAVQVHVCFLRLTTTRPDP